MPLLVQGFDNCQKETFGIKMWLAGCVPPPFCSGFPACSSPATCVLESVGISHLSGPWIHLRVALAIDGRWAKLPQQAWNYWGRRKLSFFGQLQCLLWMKSVDFEIWLLQPLGAWGFLYYTATGCTCALRCCRVTAQILWGVITTNILHAVFLLYFAFLFGQRAHLCLNIRKS